MHSGQKDWDTGYDGPHTHLPSAHALYSRRKSGRRTLRPYPPTGSSAAQPRPAHPRRETSLWSKPPKPLDLTRGEPRTAGPRWSPRVPLLAAFVAMRVPCGGVERFSEVINITDLTQRLELHLSLGCLLCGEPTLRLFVADGSEALGDALSQRSDGLHLGTVVKYSIV